MDVLYVCYNTRIHYTILYTYDILLISSSSGLCHSIYGTNVFTLMALDPKEPGARDRV